MEARACLRIRACVPLVDVALHVLPFQGALCFSDSSVWAGLVSQDPDPSRGLKAHVLGLTVRLHLEATP